MVTPRKIAKHLVEGNALRRIGPVLKRFNKENIRKIFITLDRKIGNAYRKHYTKRIRVNNNQIFFYTFQNSYTCNLKYISRELEKRGADVKIYWAVRSRKAVSGFDEGSNIIPILINKIDYFHAAMSSKIIVTNAIVGDKNYMIPVKKNQVLIETWHGSLGIKKFDPKSYNSSRDWPIAMTKTGKATTYCISNSVFEDNVYRDTYWKKCEILRYGHPRNDLFFDKSDELKNAVKEKFFKKLKITSEEQKANTHFCLYAPTFRDDHSFDAYNLNIKNVLAALTKKYGGKWYLLLRYHPTVLEEQKFKNTLQSPLIINVSSYPDIQELMLIADVGISDYSSWMFDYMLTRRPIFIYAPDIILYKGERSLYYPLESTPFPIAINNDKLVKNILNMDDFEYREKVELFLQEKGCMEDGLAAKRTVDLILKIMEEANEKDRKKKRK